MNDGYKPITVFAADKVEDTEQPKMIEVSLEEVIDNPLPMEQIGNQEHGERPALQHNDREEKRKSRAKERIQELNRNLKAAQAEKEALWIEKEDLKKKLTEGQKTSKESLKSTLTSHVTTLTKQLTEAIKQGDAEETVRIQDELMNAKMNLAGLEHELKHEYKEAKQPESPRTDSQQSIESQLPDKALEWIEEHPEFKTDRKFHTAAINVNNQLLGEGFLPDEDDFYAELNTRLAKRFPEVFGIDKENGVQLSQDTTPSKDVKIEVNTSQEPSTKARTEVSQTVSGSSRPSANTIKVSQGNKVTMSQADYANLVSQAERWGITVEQMARRIAHSEKNKRPDGYVAIDMKKA